MKIVIFREKFRFSSVVSMSLALLVPLLLLAGCGGSNSKGKRKTASSTKSPVQVPGNSLVAVSTAADKTLLLVDSVAGKVDRSLSVPANAHGVAAVGDRIFLGDRKGTGVYYLNFSGENRQYDPQFVSLGGPAHHLASSEEFVFVTVTMKNFVAVVDASTGQVKTKISMPKPYYPLVVPEQNRLYVTSKSTGSVRVIDLSTHDVVETIPVGKAPSHLARVRNRLWVTNAQSGDVSVIDTRENREIRRIPSGSDPHGIAYDPKTRLVFASNRSGKSIAVFDAIQTERVETLDAGGVPGHLTYVDGNILVALRDPGVINVLDPASLSVKRTLDVGMEPHQMVVLPSNLKDLIF